MSKDRKSSSKSTIKYFLIITAASVLLSIIFSLLRGVGISIFSLLNSTNLVSSLPIIGSLYWNIIWPLYWNLGEFFFTIFNMIIGLGFNYMIAYAIVNKKSNSNVLTIKNIIINSFVIAKNNIAVILTASVLWILTIWIPYINVGTTIGMWALVVGLSKKDSNFSPTSIFESKYRKYMGEIFLLISFIVIGTSIGYVFLIIPGLVISMAWSQAIYILIDKELTPLQAIKVSNDITYGEKLTIFIAYIVLLLILGIGMAFFGWIIALIDVPALLVIFSFFACILSSVIMIASSVYIYRQLRTRLTK